MSTPTPEDRWPCARWCCTAGCTSDGTPGQPCDCGAPGGKGPGRCNCGNAEIRAMATERDLLRDTLGSLHLYVAWRHCTKQLTTEQKEAWASAVEAWERDLYADDPRTLAELHPADRWWLCPTCGERISNGRDDGPHEGCMYAHDAKEAGADGRP